MLLQAGSIDDNIASVMGIVQIRKAFVFTPIVL